MSSDGEDMSVGIEFDGESDDDADEPDNDSPNLVRLLDEFRIKWQQELGLQTSAHDGGNDPNVSTQLTDSALSKDDAALAIFTQGIHAEQTGRLAEAVSYYRRAVQLVPDIEAKVDYHNFMIPQRARQESESSVDSVGDDDDASTTRVSHTDAICNPSYGQRGTHISALPAELMMMILKWVVSGDLDLHSLEMVSMVCKAWYRYARDEELWKLVCTRVWGIHRGRRKHYGGSWRLMYIERPHLKYSGVYISKSSYMRQGEKGVFDFYNPWYTVEYYRYMRFFPEGVMLMLTSPEDPLSMVASLRSRDSMRQGLLRGYYKMTGNTMTAVLKRVPSTITKPLYRFGRSRQQASNPVDQTFHAEFVVLSSGRRRCYRLVWTSYSVHTVRRPNGEETISQFDLTPSSYPPLYFSGVKSYTALSGGPLK